MADAIMVDTHLLGMLRCEPRAALARVERCLLESIASDSRSIKSSCLPGGPKPPANNSIASSRKCFAGPTFPRRDPHWVSSPTGHRTESCFGSYYSWSMVFSASARPVHLFPPVASSGPIRRRGVIAPCVRSIADRLEMLVAHQAVHRYRS
jgi:hypothetical protein